MKNFKPLAIFCGCAAQFVSGMVENPEDRLYCDEAHLVVLPLCADALSLTVSEKQTNILEYKKSKIKDFFPLFWKGGSNWEI